MDRSAVLATKIRSAFAPCSLGTWPAPLEAQPALACALGLQALWLKREDKSGGNKVRGLEFLFAGAASGSVFVTVGGAGSSHCLATARHARTQGLRTAVALFPQPETDASRNILAATTSAADLVVRASSIISLPWAGIRACQAAAMIRRAGIAFTVPRSAIPVRVVDAMGKGYGHPTPDGDRATALAAEHGLRLDPTYGAKAFSFFMRRETGTVKRAVYWHTFAWP